LPLIFPAADRTSPVGSLPETSCQVSGKMSPPSAVSLPEYEWDFLAAGSFKVVISGTGA
jgi:hypothetical protein